MRNACYSLVRPSLNLNDPQLIAASASVARDCLGLDPQEYVFCHPPVGSIPKAFLCTFLDCADCPALHSLPAELLLYQYTLRVARDSLGQDPR